MSQPAVKDHIKVLLGAPATSGVNIVDPVGDWPGVLEKVRTGVQDPTRKYDLVVGEFWLQESPNFKEIHALDPDISVIDIDLIRGTLSCAASSAKLSRLAEWLTTEAGLTSAPPATEPADASEEVDREKTGESSDADSESRASSTEILDLATPYETATPVSPFRPRLVSTEAPSTPNAEAQLDDLTRWLELKFALMLARSSTGTIGPDVPGWGISAKRAQAQLGADVTEQPESDLLDQWRKANERLNGYVDAAGDQRRDGSLGAICHAFGLDEIDRQIFWIAAAPDIAGNLAQAIGFLNDDLALRRPTLSLLAQMIDGAGPPWKLQQRLADIDAFSRFRLASLVCTDPLIPESLVPIRLPPDLVAMLRGRRPDSASDGIWSFDPSDWDEEFDPHLALVEWAVQRDRSERPVVRFHAPAGEGPWLGRQLASVGKRVLLGDLSTVAGQDPVVLHDRLLAFGRSALIADAILILTGLDEHSEQEREKLTRTLIRDLAPHLKLVVVQGLRTPPTSLRDAAGGIAEISRPRPTREERATIWSGAAARRNLNLSDATTRDLAATFAFDRAQAEAAIALAVGSGSIESPNASDAALREAARLVSRASAPPSVTRIETKQGWDDIIVPDSVKDDLKSIVTQVKHGTTVWEDWGFGARIPYGQAMIALLAGPSGTGKTMAAQIIAGELGAALFQVDLAKTVSKYIGETEKALDRIFEAAESASAVLLFDEADALFGKRSEIHDAHDRYANIEVNFLLQRIEEHFAPVLLTTNRKGNIDSAFLRRLNKVVDFPMPDEEQRALIWKGMLPPEAEVAKDVDLAALRNLPLSGGSIANTVLAAAFMGAEKGGVIRMHHLVAAARSELAKGGMQSAGRSLTHLIEGAHAGAKP
jgi:AAA+ superfamily predicted ATPase